MCPLDMSNYLDVYAQESAELLQAMSDCLLALEKDPAAATHIEELFRVAHTLKGMSATMGFERTAELTHHMEDLLHSIREKKHKLDSSTVDLLLECLDALQAMVEGAAAGSGEPEMDIAVLLARLSGCPESEEPEGPREVLSAEDREVLEKAARGGLSAYIVKVTLHGDCLLKSVRVYMIFKELAELGEVVRSIPEEEDLEDEKFDRSFTVYFVGQASAERIQEVLGRVSEVEKVDVEALSGQTATSSGTRVARTPTRIQKTQTVRVSISHLDKLMNLVGELVISRARLDSARETQDQLSLEDVLDRLDLITGELQEEVMSSRMVRVGQIFDRFPRMVRDVARDLGKEIEFVTEGTDIELDRSVLDEIGDPLVHLLRNAVGHGIEDPEAREAAGKPRVGTIRLSARREEDAVLVDVEEDGGGIDPESMRRTAVERGFLSEEAASALSDDEAVGLVCLPGFTTGEQVNAISGRGVGVDAVKEKIESLGGSLEIESELGVGTRFTLTLPLTLAIVQALLVEVSDRIYALPLANVTEIVKVEQDKLRTIHNEDVILLHGRVLPLVYAEEALGVADRRRGSLAEREVVVAGSGEKLKGLVVDRLLGQQEIVIKPLDDMLRGLKGVAGATILGDGRVALILDVRSLAA